MNKDKFTFSYEGQDGTVLKMEFLEEDDVTWMDVQKKFHEFLNGLGYYVREEI